MQLTTENEISIKIQLKKFKMPDYMDDVRRQTLILYYDNGMRISDGKQQLKCCLSKHNVLKILDGDFLPCSITKATEECKNYDLFKHNLNVIITRFILYEDENKQRISIDFQNHTYYLNGESEDVSRAGEFYKLYMYYYNKFKEYIDDNYYDKFEIQKFDSIPSRKLEIFKIGDVAEYVYLKYKYDGYKGKFVANENGVYYFDSIGVITKINLPDIFHKYKNIIFQVEMIENTNGVNYMIITDIIGLYINKQLYSTTPTDVLNFLNELHIPEGFIVHVNQLSFMLRKQHVYSEGPITRFDGYIMVTEQNEYKVKFPTIDLHLQNNFFYAYDTNGKQYQVSDYKYLYQDGIYEVMRDLNDMTGIYRLMILRRRYDRNYPSTLTEYETFKEANDKWMPYFNQKSENITYTIK